VTAICQQLQLHIRVARPLHDLERVRYGRNVILPCMNDKAGSAQHVQAARYRGRQFAHLGKRPPGEARQARRALPALKRPMLADAQCPRGQQP